MVAVAYSGGRDSTALLHATMATAQVLGLRVVALHVHHGLNAAADAWLAHCADRCRRWAKAGRPVEFRAERLIDRPEAGASIEAWARQQRYRALRRMTEASGASLVLLAQHRRDQAETFVLQALRGGGVAALSAMPRVVHRDGLTWARPWLDRPREAIDAYLRRHRLGWIEDDSNADERFARNRLRRRVWPELVAAFPDAEASLAMAARWAQQAAQASAGMAASDLRAIAGDGGLSIAAWQALPEARRGAALRHWLHGRLGRPAAPSLVARLLAEVRADRAQRWPVPVGELRSQRGHLQWRAGLANPPNPPPASTPVDLSRPGRHEIAAWGGVMYVERVDSGGLPQAIASRLELRGRAAEDRFQAGSGRPPRRLKLQFQTKGIEAADRRGPVVVSADGRIVFVAGLGLDARALAAPGEKQVSLIWVPSETSRSKGHLTGRAERGAG